MNGISPVASIHSIFSAGNHLPWERTPIRQIFELDAPRLAYRAQGFTDLLVTNRLVGDESREALNRPPSTVYALNGEHTGKCAADRLGHAKVVHNDATAHECWIPETDRGILQALPGILGPWDIGVSKACVSVHIDTDERGVVVVHPT